jgi:hypothetical protein
VNHRQLQNRNESLLWSQPKEKEKPVCVPVLNISIRYQLLKQQGQTSRKKRKIDSSGKRYTYSPELEAKRNVKGVMISFRGE